MNNEQKKEFTARIVNANRSELVVIKYEMIFAYMQDGDKEMQAGNWEQVKLAITRVEQILNRLIKDLDFTYEISTQLYPLYRFCLERLAMCRVKKDLTGMHEAKKVLDNLYKAFLELAKTDNSKPLMANSQQLITGVTYGKNSLNDTYSSNESNRGYFI